MNSLETIQLIVKSAGMDAPVPQEMRAFFHESSRKNLIVILRKAGKCGLFTLCAINLLFLLKKLGLSLTVAKAYIVLTVATALTAGTAVTASAVAVHSVITRTHTAAAPQPKPETVQPAPALPAPETKASPMRQIFEKHRHVEKVRLKDGSIFEGALRSRDGVVTLITPEGTLTFSQEDIETIEYVSPDSL